jgi:hypothetical protein
VLYYIKLSQYALSHDAYLFYQKLKKNTEQLGSIFDAQPSELSSNIHCVTDPDVICNWFCRSIGTSTERYFHKQPSGLSMGATPDCSKIIIYNDPDSIKPYRYGYIPLDAV